MRWALILLLLVLPLGCKGDKSTNPSDPMSVSEILGWWMEEGKESWEREEWMAFIEDPEIEIPGYFGDVPRGKWLWATRDSGCLETGSVWRFVEASETSVTLDLDGSELILDKGPEGTLRLSFPGAESGPTYLSRSVNPCFGSEEQAGSMSADDIFGWWEPISPYWDDFWVMVGARLGFIEDMQNGGAVPRGRWAVVWDQNMDDCTATPTPSTSWSVAGATNGSITICFDEWNGCWKFERRAIDNRLRLSCVTEYCNGIDLIFLERSSDPCPQP